MESGLNYGFVDFLGLLGGLGVFIYGMKIMSEAIQKIAGKSMRNLLNTFTDNKFSGWVTGALTTTLVQSSSATTVMVVSFVNAGLLKVRQAIGVIMGANFGTTTTAWLVTYFGLMGKFSVSSMALPVIAIGVPLMFTGQNKKKFFGEFLLGFGLLFLGLHFMKGGVPDFKHNPEYLSFLANFTDGGYGSILLFVLIGTVMTVVVQSSSAAMTITLVMVNEGWVPLEVGVAMVLGENIGTTVTAYLASLIGNVNSKRAARAHMIFNLFGVFWMLIVLFPFLHLVDWMNINFLGMNHSLFTTDTTERAEVMKTGLSIFHSSFNVLNAALLIWFVPQLEKIVIRLVPDKAEKKRRERIHSSTLINTPELAVMEGKNDLNNIAKLSHKMYVNFKMLYADQYKSRDKLLSKLKKQEDETDMMEMDLSNFLVDVAQGNASEETSDNVMQMINIGSELERVADVVFEVSLAYDRLDTMGLELKPKMRRALDEMLVKVDDAFVIMLKNLEKDHELVDMVDASRIENEINLLRDQIKENHLERVKKKEDAVKTGLIFRDILFGLERIGDHIYNVSEAIVRLK